MKKLLSLLLALCLLAGCAAALAERYEYGIYQINQFGNVVLNVYGNTFAKLGFDFGDVVDVEVAGQTYRMPVGSNYSDVDSGEMICRVKLAQNDGDSAVVLSINGGDFATTTGLAEKVAIEADPGYEWHYDENATIAITMAEKGGYANEYMLRQLQISNDRADYPDLTDEAFANFRMVNTTGIAPYALYRSSSPIDPSFNRNAEADEALNNAGVTSIINLADLPAAMKAYEGFNQTYYAQRDVLALGLTTDFASAGFRAGMAGAARFIVQNEGPFLIHCKQGRDRTGFLCAVLECLMGASIDEVVADYMQSYVNFYHLSPEEDKYALIAEKNIVAELKGDLGVADPYGADADLAGAAEAYLGDIGLTGDEIEALRQKLSAEP